MLGSTPAKFAKQVHDINIPYILTLFSYFTCTSFMAASIVQTLDTCSFDDEIQVPDVIESEIPECEGIPRRRWNTRCVIIYNEEGRLVAEGTCHSVSSDLVL